MADDMLSQNDIDALLSGLEGAGPAPAPPPPAPAPAPAPVAAAPAPARAASGPGDNLRRAAASVAETATADLSRKVEVRNVDVVRKPGSAMREMLKLPAVVFSSDSPTGGFVVAMPKDMAARVSDIKMGGDGNNPPATISDLYLSAISEFSNLLSGSFMTAIGSGAMLSNQRVQIVETPEELAGVSITRHPMCSILTVSVSIENLMEGEWVMMMGEQSAPQPQAAPASPVVSGEARPVQKVEFGSFEASPPPMEIPANLNLLLDVPMNVTVELGRTKMTVHDVLNLGSGSIVELDKLAGEPVDLMVNGKLIAKGEVVVIDENFGLRITDIVSPMERFRGSV